MRNSKEPDSASRGRPPIWRGWCAISCRWSFKVWSSCRSGGRDAKSYLRSAYAEGLDEDRALDVAIGALIAAAEEDTATGGPDVQRGIYPNVVTVTAAGFYEVPDERVAAIAATAMEATR